MNEGEDWCLRLAALVAAALASTAGAGSTTAERSQALSCSSTLKIALVAPFTGGAGFLGNEQLSWAKYAVKTLAPKLGLKISLVTGDTPGRAGSGPGPDAGSEVRRRQERRRGDRPVDVRRRRRVEQGVLRRQGSRTSRRPRRERR